MDAIIAFSELESFIDNPVRTYSSGMYTRLGFAVASHVDSDVLLLDEVLAVGDEAFQRKCLGRIFEYRRGGGTVLFVSHDAEAVERVCDRAVLLEHGEVAADGTPGDVLATYRRGLARARRRRARRGTRRTPPTSGAPGAWRSPPSAWSAPRARPTASRAARPSRSASTSPRPALVPSPVFGFELRSIDGTLCYGTNTHRSTHPIASVRGTGLDRLRRRPPAAARGALPAQRRGHLRGRERDLPLDRPPHRVLRCSPAPVGVGHRRRGRQLVGHRGRGSG